MISEADHHSIMEAVAKAEAATDGEIVCVLAHQVSHYPEVPMAAGAVAALGLPPLLLALGLKPVELLARFDGGWTAAHALGDLDVAHILDAYGLTQAVLFLAAAAIASIPSVKRALTPKSLRHHRVHRAAKAQYAANGLHLGAGRTGVVIFASLDERMVEILAEKRIHKLVGAKVWNAAVAAVQAGMKANDPAHGFVSAVEICGAALAQHFPSTGPRANDIPDRLLEL